MIQVTNTAHGSDAPNLAGSCVFCNKKTQLRAMNTNLMVCELCASTRTTGALVAVSTRPYFVNICVNVARSNNKE